MDLLGFKYFTHFTIFIRVHFLLNYNLCPIIIIPHFDGKCPPKISLCLNNYKMPEDHIPSMVHLSSVFIWGRRGDEYDFITV